MTVHSMLENRQLLGYRCHHRQNGFFIVIPIPMSPPFGGGGGWPYRDNLTNGDVGEKRTLMLLPQK